MAHSTAGVPAFNGFSEHELYLALRIDMTADDARRLARDLALTEEVAAGHATGKGPRGESATVDPDGELRVETNIAPYTLQLLACQGPDVERRVESYMRRKGWLDDPAYRAWKDELERLRPIVALRMQQLKDD